MKQEFKSLIEKEYGLDILSIEEAPRQFVAETYVIEVSDGKKYFCKIINKPLFIPNVVRGLPALKEVYDKGLKRINYPIPTTTKELYIKTENTLIVLFNYIDNAKQSYEYDMYSFGKFIADLHNITPKISSPMRKEAFSFKYIDLFEKQLKQALEVSSDNEVLQSLKKLLLKYEEEIRHDYTNFLKLGKELKQQNLPMVITHGDPGGNVLVESPTDIYLIDWDDILLAPPERDTWFSQNKPEFLRGYQTIFPDYQVNEKLSRFFTYKRYFEDLIDYFAEIFGDGSQSHKSKNLQALKDDCFEGWLRPSVRRFDPL